MASSTPTAGLDTMVTVKVQFAGLTRRTKMPLRDMVPKTLESNIRAFLHLPADAQPLFERYSDSAGAYVVLDSDNIPIYKQLYRAAKAKSKLKIRVTLPDRPQKTLPKPVTVEDEAGAASSPTTATPPEEKPEEKPMESSQEKQISPAPTPTSELPVPASAASVIYPNRATRRRPCGSSTLFDPPLDTRRELEARLASLMPPLPAERQIPAPYPRVVDSVWSTTPPPPPPVSYHPARPNPVSSFAVCCNNCDETIPDVHYHCSTCDDGDYDLCQSCVEQGITCNGKDHWLIKRTTVDGRLVQSVTETIAPKAKTKALKNLLKEVFKEELKEEPKEELKAAPEERAKEEPRPVVKVETMIETKVEPKDDVPSLPKPAFEPLIARWGASSLGIMRTCNCCVQELPEKEFLHCQACDDYDLCQPCFSKNAHGHHPKHAFSPAVEGTMMPHHIKVKMAPGRNQMHSAICDGCDRYITGVRHKCLDCPDWDFCVDCIKQSQDTHPNHRFVPIYEQLPSVRPREACAPVHVGICCDGHLCAGTEAYPAYIRGIRYKCAVCNDMDLCANCEASPGNTHNKTHPMIMFKTPVRHVSVTTSGEHQDGLRMPAMGDRRPATSKATETGPIRINSVQTVMDVKPSETVQVKKPEPKPEPKPAPASLKNTPTSRVSSACPDEGLKAVFVRDTILDGTILPPNQVFEQTWVLRNEGTVTWPAGCSVKFVGGDYMGHVDSNHPAGISELVSASESTVCYAPLAPGQEFPFTVLLRTPARAGKVVSYWRLTSPSGHKFGHRLWCDVRVRMTKPDGKPEAKPEVKTEVKPEDKPEIVVDKSEAKPEPEPKIETPAEETKAAEDSQASSQMIFPKLETESPVASIHEATSPEPAPLTEQETEIKDSGDEEWDLSEDGFMTDEEYDILDASDEEYLEEQKKKVATK